MLTIRPGDIVWWNNAAKSVFIVAVDVAYVHYDKAYTQQCTVLWNGQVIENVVIDFTAASVHCVARVSTADDD